MLSMEYAKIHTSANSKMGDLSDIYRLYSKRTNYEIAYVLEENNNENIIVFIMAGTREIFYGQLKNYLY